MRQSDIMNTIRDIIVEANIDASPENFELCHRFVTKSDPSVVTAFEQSLGSSTTIDAASFQTIRDNTAIRIGEQRVTQYIESVDSQLTSILGMTSVAIEDVANYSKLLAVGNDHLQTRGMDAGASKLLGNLIAHTVKMADRAKSLESNLHIASSELSTLRDDLAQARRESESDVLTSLPNRRAFERLLDVNLIRAERLCSPLSLAFFDVDHFKAFNDKWGHKLGDQVLRFVGSQMMAQFRELCVPARFGGEEFVVLLPGYGSADAFAVVRQFCESVGARTIRVRSDGREVGRITLSAGVVTLRRGEGADSLVERADQAMYVAKQSGRNRVHHAV